MARCRLSQKCRGYIPPAEPALAKAIFERNSIDIGDDVTLEDTDTGKLWTEAEILKLAQGA
jgi:hypothetical protein